MVAVLVSHVCMGGCCSSLRLHSVHHKHHHSHQYSHHSKYDIDADVPDHMVYCRDSMLPTRPSLILENQMHREMKIFNSLLQNAL